MRKIYSSNKEDTIHILLSHKQNEIMPYELLDLEIIMLSELSQTKTNIMISFICGI